MKKTLALTALLAAFVLFGVEPGIREMKKEITRDGSALTKIEKIVTFPNGARISYMEMRDAAGKSVQKKWGDFMLGLEFGTPKGSSGGWDRWSILNVNILKNGKLEDLVKPPLDKMTFKDGILTIVLRGAVLTMRSAKEFPDFLFVRVVWDAGNREKPYMIRFNSYPGATNFNGTRYLSDGENSFEMKKGVGVSASSNMFLVSNKGSFEKSGNIILWGEKYSRVVSTMWGAPVVFDFYPKSGLTTFNYAIGFFNDANPENVLEKLEEGKKAKLLDFMLK